MQLKFTLEDPEINLTRSGDAAHFYEIANIGNSQARILEDLGGEDDYEKQLTDLQLTSEHGKYMKYSGLITIISILSALLILTFQSYMFAVINLHRNAIESNQRYVEVSIFFSLFVFAAVFQVVVTLIGVVTNNLLILLGMAVFYGCMLIYSGIQYNEVLDVIAVNLERGWKDSTKGTNIATIATIGVTFILELFFIIFIVQKYVKWFSFKRVGADLNMRRMYLVFQIFRVCLIFDFFFFLGFTIQFIVIMIKDKTSGEFIVTVCVLPLTLLVLFMADFAATREWIWLSLVTVALFCGGIFYVLFKTIRLYTHYSSAYGLSIHPGQYFPGRKSLVTFSVFSLVLLIVTLVVEIFIMKQYGQGLVAVVSDNYSWLPGSKRKIETPSEKTEEASFVID